MWIKLFTEARVRSLKSAKSGNQAWCHKITHTNLMTIDSVKKQSIKFDTTLMHSLKRVDSQRLVKWLQEKKH